MQRGTWPAVLAGLFLMLILVPGAWGASPAGCAVCHGSMTGTVTTAGGAEISLGVDMQRFEASVHGFLSCTDCHLKFTEDPHTPPDEAVGEEVSALAERIAGKAKVDPVALGACTTCHSEIYGQVLGSVHGRNITEKGETDGALCLDCHGSPHYIVPKDGEGSLVNREHSVETCGRCHGSEDLLAKYGLELNVMKGYEESFHGKKHHLGHRRAPTCVSCHGAHDVRSKTDPASTVATTANKIKLCGSCHEGANAKFVVSYTHKPAGPIPHYAEKGLIVLLISTIAFTIVHVILEAYADVRDTVFRGDTTEGGKKHGNEYV